MLGGKVLTPSARRRSGLALSMMMIVSSMPPQLLYEVYLRRQCRGSSSTGPVRPGPRWHFEFCILLNDFCAVKFGWMRLELNLHPPLHPLRQAPPPATLANRRPTRGTAYTNRKAPLSRTPSDGRKKRISRYESIHTTQSDPNAFSNSSTVSECPINI